MDDSTFRALNDLNRRFYATVAEDFDATRQQPWEGWLRLREMVSARRLAALDVGCGNGRFGVYMADRLTRYVGIDSSSALLAHARQALAAVDATLIERDLLTEPPDEALGTFDLVALFGVLHHVPGADRRLHLIRSLAERVAPGGWLVWTEWRFLDLPRFRERIVPWDGELQVEPGDYLLDWRRGANALRYCHAVDDAEHARLVDAAGLTLVAEYRADAANVYTVLKREKC
jgi:tRNA (uracil-5-)-methyltransferase TRM9